MLRKKKSKGLQKQRKLVTYFEPKSPITEQYRTVRTNIQFSSVDEEIKTLMITSSGPMEGKSTTSANLAVVFAQQGKKVLFVDADLRKPSSHYTFSFSNSIGLTSVLTRKVELRDAVHVFESTSLHVLTSGPLPPNPAELLSSRAMKEMIEQAKQDYDLVLFDTPPITAVTDAQVIASLCQAAVLVVSSGQTEVELAIKAKELLENSGVKILGAVLNNKKTKDSTYYYYGKN